MTIDSTSLVIHIAHPLLDDTELNISAEQIPIISPLAVALIQDAGVAIPGCLSFLKNRVAELSKTQQRLEEAKSNVKCHKTLSILATSIAVAILAAGILCIALLGGCIVKLMILLMTAMAYSIFTLFSAMTLDDIQTEDKGKGINCIEFMLAPYYAIEKTLKRVPELEQYVEVLKESVGELFKSSIVYYRDQQDGLIQNLSEKIEKAQEVLSAIRGIEGRAPHWEHEQLNVIANLNNAKREVQVAIEYYNQFIPIDQRHTTHTEAPDQQNSND